jgi:hypothetical protein
LESKGFQPLLSVVFGAIVTAFIAVSFILKETTISERFPIYIAVNQGTNLPFPLENPFSTFGSMASRANREEAPDNTVKQREVAFKSADEKFDFYCELIQFEIVSQLYTVLRRAEMISMQAAPSGQPIITSEVFKIERPETFTKIDGKRVLQALSRNRFLEKHERTLWDSSASWIPVPKNANLSAPDSRSIVLARPGYFKAMIRVDPIGAGNGTPLYLAEKLRDQRVETLCFAITTEAVFDKFTSGSPYTEETMNWVRLLFDRLKIAFSAKEE